MEFFMTYIFPVLILLVLGALFAFILSYLGTKLEVPVDERVSGVRELLSGANCGGCGLAGCDAFADAVVNKGASLDGCAATSKENKAKIAEILGVSAGDGEEMVAVVACAGGNRATDKHEYHGYGDCISSAALAGGSKACPNGCMGLGTCVNVCKFNALTVSKDAGYASVSDRNCVACKACVAACPKKLIGLVPKSAKVFIACSNNCRGKEVLDACQVSCIGCGKCAKTCPVGAIEVVDNLAVIDYSKCTNCGTCVDICPRKSIHKKA